LICEEAWRDIGVFQGKNWNFIEHQRAIVLRQGEVKDKSVRQIFADLILDIPKRQVRNIESDEHASLFCQPFDTRKLWLFCLGRGCNERQEGGDSTARKTSGTPHGWEMDVICGVPYALLLEVPLSRAAVPA
jgi:hypothetical protein